MQENKTEEPDPEGDDALLADLFGWTTAAKGKLGKGKSVDDLDDEEEHHSTSGSSGMKLPNPTPRKSAKAQATAPSLSSPPTKKQRLNQIWIAGVMKLQVDVDQVLRILAGSPSDDVGSAFQAWGSKLSKKCATIVGSLKSKLDASKVEAEDLSSQHWVIAQASCKAVQEFGQLLDLLCPEVATDFESRAVSDMILQMRTPNADVVGREWDRALFTCNAFATMLRGDHAQAARLCFPVATGDKLSITLLVLDCSLFL